jgi:ribosomal-protein-alanine N-acetyltransferase
VYLRAPAARDRDELLALNRLSATLFRGLTTRMKDSRAFDRYLERSSRPNCLSLLVCRRDNDAIVGAFTISEIVGGIFKSGYLGYNVFAPFARQGYMAAAMPLVLRHAFNRLKLHRLEANIQPSNHRSIALVRRAGFSREGYSPKYLRICGTWRDHERWALLVDDWRRARARTRR